MHFALMWDGMLSMGSTNSFRVYRL